MKDPFVNDSGIDSPARDSMRNIEGCYNKNIFKGKSFANSRRALQSGAEKITRTFKSVRNTFGNLSQVYIYVNLIWLFLNNVYYKLMFLVLLTFSYIILIYLSFKIKLN